MTTSQDSFSEIYFLGDSLTDGGNRFAIYDSLLTVGLPLDEFGYNQNFTNSEIDGDGLMWSQQIGGLIGADASSVYNFAYGGATAMGIQTIQDAVGDRSILLDHGLTLEDLAPNADGSVNDTVKALLAANEYGLEQLSKLLVTDNINLTGQVQNVLAFAAEKNGVSETGEVFQENSAAFLLIGGNDYVAFNPLTDDATAFVTDLVTTILGSAQALVAAGIDTLIYTTQPPASIAPISQIAAEQAKLYLMSLGTPEPEAEAIKQQILAGLDTMVAQQNAFVQQGLAQLAAATGVEVKVVDFNRMSVNMAEDMSSFGLEYAGSAYLTTGSIAKEFIDADGDGNPEVINYLGLPAELQDGEYISADIDGDGTPDLIVETDPAAAGYDLDEIAFLDPYHPTAAVQDMIARLTEASLNDTVAFLSAGDDFNFGSSEDSLVFAEAGDDTVCGESGQDVLFGGLGDDSLDGGDGKDVVVGGAGDDCVKGGNDADVVSGSDGDDVLFGGNGNDILVGGRGDDHVFGGRGNDLFVQKLDPDAEETDVLSGGRGRDALFVEVKVDGDNFTDADFAAVEQGLENALQHGWSTFVFRDVTWSLSGIEEVFVANSADAEAFAAVYADALDFVHADSELVALAADWNQIDPDSYMV
mgnify:CR=1 FL=1